MQSKPYLVVSDLHLGAVPRATERAFRAFLAHAADAASGLLINGDLFDFWFEYRAVILREHYRVLAALADVVEAGVPVAFIGGNHDGWAGSFLEDEVGVRVLKGPLVMELAGRRTLVAHGDGLGSGDLGYRILRGVIRHPLTVGAFRALHPDLGVRIAQHASATEARQHGGGRSNAGRAEFLATWADEQMLSDPSLDLIVVGHSHMPVLEELRPGRYYVNTGDWIEHFTYLSLDPAGGPPELLRWPIG
jgi:UDP-2,3-diacylglucosamine hydrolase